VSLAFWFPSLSVSKGVSGPRMKNESEANISYNKRKVHAEEMERKKKDCNGR
jgi:hypothetical protein